MAWLPGNEYSVRKAEAKAGTEGECLYDGQPLGALYISAVSIAEIRFGIELQQDVRRRAELNEWLTGTLRPAFKGRITCP